MEPYKLFATPPPPPFANCFPSYKPTSETMAWNNGKKYSHNVRPFDDFPGLLCFMSVSLVFRDGTKHLTWMVGNRLYACQDLFVFTVSWPIEVEPVTHQ